MFWIDYTYCDRSIKIFALLRRKSSRLYLYVINFAENIYFENRNPLCIQPVHSGHTFQLNPQKEQTLISYT